IVPEFESLIEQYKLYVEDDFVDYELMQVSTKTSKINSIPSLIQKKYVYPQGEEYLKLKYLFFSNMSHLFDYKKYGSQYSHFYELIRNETININDYNEPRKEFVIQQIQNGYLKTDSEGNISFVNRDKILIIGYFRMYDVMSYWYFPKSIRDELDRMNEDGLVKFSDKLFTVAEQEYLDYYLNNRFSNGIWLRNKYVHATNSHDIEEQQNDYKILIKLLVLVVLKIEDDLFISKSMFTIKNGPVNY
ncbi:MAG: hypothetical protein JNN23_08350, partial [Chryseobacterium gambrini]|nr:hypothetical protein [Chryseobacterium gambrini]